MHTTYYIFQKNKVVFPSGLDTPRPLSTDEMDELRSGTKIRMEVQDPLQKRFIAAEIDANNGLPANFTSIPLRRLLGWVDDQHFIQWGKAAQLLHWLDTNRYCGKCGTPTEKHPKELARLCPVCNINHYPAIAPCVIVLVHRQDQMLLARAHRFPPKLFSTLAGFIEPGETAEEAVAREIYEEVAIEVRNIQYFKSQPWPFPAQLMLGFIAEFAAGQIHADGDEISEAAWYSPENLPQIPSEGTIAGQLIRHHLKGLDSSSLLLS